MLKQKEVTTTKDEGAVFQLLPMTKDNTREGTKTAWLHLTEFCAKSGMPVPNELPMATVCCMDFWSRYATYLMTIKKANNEPYARRSLLQYFTTVKGEFCRKWGDKEGFALCGDPPPVWYTDIYRALNHAIKDSNLVNEIGEPEQGATLNVECLVSACMYFLSPSSAFLPSLSSGQSANSCNDTSASTSAQNRHAMALDYHAVGRANELAHVSWTTVSGTRDGFSVDWGMPKTGTACKLNFFANFDSANYPSCVLNSAACNLMFSSSSTNSLMLSNYSGLSLGGAANKISGLLARASSKVVELKKPHVSSHSIRRTAINELAASKDLTFFEVVARTGHSTDNTAVVYLFKERHQMVSGRVLAGVFDPRKVVSEISAQS